MHLKGENPDSYEGGEPSLAGQRDGDESDDQDGPSQGQRQWTDQEAVLGFL